MKRQAKRLTVEEFWSGPKHPSWSKSQRASQLAALADKAYAASEPMSSDDFEALLRASNAKYAPVETCPRVKREPVHVPGRYAVKCDDCKTEIRRTDSMAESAQGGRCNDCQANLPRFAEKFGKDDFIGAETPVHTPSEPEGLKATSVHGDEWTGEMQDGIYIYRDQIGNLYESKERPAYRIRMDNAQMTVEGIAPILPEPVHAPGELDYMDNQAGKQ